jgi:ribonuclease BN (tRNA processing enzyme)
MEFYNGWQKVIDIGSSDNKLVGFSRASFKTGLIILPLKICLDAGVCNQYEPNMILITHGHTDHVGELYNILIGNNRKFKVPVVSTPNLINHISNYINSMASMNRGCNFKYNKWEPCSLINKKRFEIQGKTIQLEPITMDHSVESIGFGISEIREKLKTEFENLTQEELIEKKRIYKITYEKDFPMYLFCGDTGNSALPLIPFSKFPVVIIEATFLHSDDINEAREKKHLHITDLEPYFNANPTITFVLIHFSTRYNLEKLKEFQVHYENIYSNIKFFV